MKKKMLCLACAAVMGLSMSTTAFAKVGSGDVDGDGTLTANDSAMILQRTLDYTYNGTETDSFNLDEANYDGDSDVDGGDWISANDAAFVLQDVLNPQSDVYLTVQAGVDSPLTFCDVINENDGVYIGEKTLVVDYVDSLFSGKYDTEITNNANVLNNFVDKIEFGQNGRTTSIRSDLGWSKFANAVGGVVTDEAAFAELENSVKNNRYSNVADIKADYETLKKAFGPSSSADSVKATGDKVIEITGADFVTVTKLNSNLQPIEGTTMNLSEIVSKIADNNLQAYDTVTIDQLTEVFGSRILVTAQNPNNGYKNQAIIYVERR